MATTEESKSNIDASQQKTPVEPGERTSTLSGRTSLFGRFRSNSRSHSETRASKRRPSRSERRGSVGDEVNGVTTSGTFIAKGSGDATSEGIPKGLKLSDLMNGSKHSANEKERSNSFVVHDDSEGPLNVPLGVRLSDLANAGDIDINEDGTDMSESKEGIKQKSLRSAQQGKSPSHGGAQASFKNQRYGQGRPGPGPSPRSQAMYRAPTTVKKSPRAFKPGTRPGLQSSGGDDDGATVMSRRGEVSAEVFSIKQMSYKKTMFRKSDDVRKLLRKAVDQCELFHDLNDAVRQECVDAFESEKRNRNEIVIQEGDQGEKFYVLGKGNCEVTKLQWNDKLGDAAPKRVKSYEPGDYFGELALLYNEPRKATIRVTSEKSELWFITRRTFKSIQVHFKMKRHQLYEESLRRIDLIKNLTSEEVGKILDAVEEMTYEKDDIIMREGDDGDRLYVILEGEVTYKRVKDGELGTSGKGDYFGEKALAENEKRAATVTANNRVVCMTLTRQKLEETLGPLDQLFRQARPKSVMPPKKENNHKYHIAMRFEDLDTKLGVSENPKAARQGRLRRFFSDEQDGGASALKKELVLGVGTFGKVIIVKHKQTQQTYAMKKLNKVWIVENELEQHVVDERNVMTLTDHPFLLKLHNSYWDDHHVYFVLELCQGGELFTYLRKAGKFTEQDARFFIGCVVEAFDHLHRKSIVYRDLKPENLMLDNKGFVKMVDFGLAKVVKNRTWTLCGTPEYLAPEIVLSRGHNKAVDFWALGVLTYELVTGDVPFTGDDNMEVFQKILANNPEFPAALALTPPCKSIIREFLKTKQLARLGNNRLGIRAIREHAWFVAGGFDWAALKKLKVVPPIIPKVSNREDTSNFEVYDDEDIHDFEDPPPCDWEPAFPYQVKDGKTLLQERYY